MKNLKDKIVIITGASSGNGKAAAIEFAKAGAKLVLASRSNEAIEALAEECRKFGVTAISVKTDVTYPQELKNLIDTTIEHFGRIDVLVNNAGIGCVGKLNDTPIEAHQQVIATNLMGAIYASHAVMPHFKKQKHGVIISTNSAGAFIPLPYASSYTASKFALRGFMEALRAEVSDEKHIHICEVFPAFVTTPGVEHAGNFIGKELTNPPLAGSPITVAKALVSLAKKPKDRKMVMFATCLGRFGYFLMPRLVRWATARGMDFFLSRAKDVAKTEGNLFKPKSGPRSIHAK